MKPLELQISKAAPSVDAAALPSNAEPANPIDGVETLGPGLPMPRRRPGLVRTRPIQAILALALLALGASTITSTLTPAPEQHGHEIDGGPAPVSGEAGANAPVDSPVEWRRAVLLNPWADASAAVEASIDLPATWSVHRHEPSADYPGLHATVMDQDSLPVAVLYFGPAANSPPCPLQPPPDIPLHYEDIATGAELIDPAIAAAFSYGLTNDLQPRGSFGLVARTSAGLSCGAPVGATGTSLSVLRFGDLLGLGSNAPQSSYARTFVSADDAHRYLQSDEFSTLKRLVSSLRFTFPEDRSAMWQLPPQRRPVG